MDPFQGSQERRGVTPSLPTGGDLCVPSIRHFWQKAAHLSCKIFSQLAGHTPVVVWERNRYWTVCISSAPRTSNSEPWSPKTKGSWSMDAAVGILHAREQVLLIRTLSSGHPAFSGPYVTNSEDGIVGVNKRREHEWERPMIRSFNHVWEQGPRPICYTKCF